MKWASRFALILLFAFLASGCFGTQRISVEYLPDVFPVQRLHQEEPITVALNQFWDDRPFAEKIGEGYNLYGGRVETWVNDRPPTQVLEDALVSSLERAGFHVLRTSGWNLSASDIPAHLNADYIMGGRLRAFWVESRPGMLTVSVNSNVTYDLIIADVEEQRVLWTGQFVGSDTVETLVRTKNDMRESMNRSLTRAVNQAFQDPGVRQVMLTMVQLRF